MLSESAVLLLEVTTPMTISNYWPLCEQLAAISPTKVTVFTHAEPATWTTTFDAVMATDSGETSVCLKWRASRHGGGTLAAPTATRQALAASKRHGKTTGGRQMRMAEVVVDGEVGKEDGQVLRLLMQHAIQRSGLQLTETAPGSEQKLGEYLHLASADPLAPPGRVRVLVSTDDEVRKIRNALHGQCIQVGGDKVRVRVCNDFLDSRATPGNSRGAR